MNPRAVRILMIVVVTMLLTSAAALAGERTGQAGQCRGWCADLIDPATGQPLSLERAGFEVDVFGTVLSGHLVEEFTNLSSNAVVAEYRHRVPANLRAGAIAYETNGETVVVARKDQPAPKGGRAKPAGAIRIELDAGQSVIVKTAFRMQLSLNQGRLALVLPAIGSTSPARAEQTAAYWYRVNIDYDEPLNHVESTTHEISADYEGERTVIELADGEALESRKFALEFSFGDEDDATLLSYAGRERDGVREVLAVITPPARVREGSARPKQMLFVLDRSGSMGKDHKFNQARKALQTSLAKLTDIDTFNIVEFDSEFTMMADEPVVADKEALKEARAWLATLRPRGKTMLFPALTATLDQPEDTRRHEMIVLLTDGVVEDAAQVERTLRKQLGPGRLFIVGIGEEVHRKNILRFAEVGRGTAVFAKDPATLNAALVHLFDQVSEPLLWDIQFDWGTANVQSIKPSRIPDLYGGRSVTIRARVRGDLPERLEVTGETMDGPRTFSTRLRTRD